MYEAIKKQNGESFAKVIRDFHNGIFEIHNLDKIVKFAGNNASDAESILTYLVSLLSKDSSVDECVEDPFVLLDRAGYNAFYADNQSKQDSISKYFTDKERLCTFGTDRYKHYYIVNAVKKDVDSILRTNFNGIEKREDLYGTSVISIQMAKKGGFISIKNRYNHTVPNCDNTFSSNPDNIIAGLSKSLQNHFKISFSVSNNKLPDGYTLAGDCVFKINQEINGIYYGDIAYLSNGEIVEVKTENHEYLFDYFIFNAKDKLFRLVDTTINDSFPEDFNRVYGGKKSVYVKKHCIYDGDIMLVGV